MCGEGAGASAGCGALFFNPNINFQKCRASAGTWKVREVRGMYGNCAGNARETYGTKVRGMTLTTPPRRLYPPPLRDKGHSIPGG
eukprot:gene23595-biopygen17836